MYSLRRLAARVLGLAFGLARAVRPGEATEDGGAESPGEGGGEG